jgi:diguanylate cyclase (GGDEF)-like protein
MSIAADATPGDHPASTSRSRVRNWPVWSIDPAGRLYLLAISVISAGAVVAVLLRISASGTDAWRAAILIGLSTLYAELADRVERLRRHLGDGGVWANQTSVWAFAGALVLPAGYAAIVVIAIYGHILVRDGLQRTARPHRVVFSCANTLLGTLAAVGVQNLTGERVLLHGDLDAAGVLVAAVGLYSGLSLLVAIPAAYLLRRPETWRAVVPGREDITFEVSTILLGVVAAGLILHTAWLTPIVLALLTILHRSTLVRQLEVAASTDAKTSLLHAGAWQDRATQYLVRAEREQRSAAVLLVDLDFFKRVNDEHGHQAGDIVLRAIAECLKHELRGYDAVGRYGGEEFVAFLDNVTPDNALSIAGRVIDKIRVAAPEIDGATEPITITASVGVAMYPASGTELDELIRAADAALYAAKHAGRDQVRLAGPPPAA